MEAKITETNKAIAETAEQVLKPKLRGELLFPNGQGYDKARTLWNIMIDRHPAMIVRCAGTADVIEAVRFARANGLVLSVKGGGHSFSGKSVCDGGLVVDLSLMRSVWVDPLSKTARAEAGALVSDLDHETQAFGLAVTAGVVSHTGIGGLTLGGGQGYLMNRYGLTIDNLLSADVVLADGRFVKASATENEDLFWGIKGGGGNFGVVTSFEYQLHRVGPDIIGGMLLYPMDHAKEVFEFYAYFSMNSPDEMSVAASLLTLPDGTGAIGLVAGWVGDVDEGQRQLEPLRTFKKPMLDLISVQPYVQLQKSLDAAMPHGWLRHGKMGYISEFKEEFIDIVLKHAEQLSPYSLILFNCMKGAVTRVASDKTPFPYREPQWYFDIIPQWTHPSQTAGHIQWARSFWEEAEPFTRGTAVNFFSIDDGTDRVKLAYGENYERLAQIKQKYDPDNFFAMNNNILPER